MITGELEYLYGKGAKDYEYDYFFKKWFKKRTKQQKEAARKKRQQFFAQGGKANEIIGGVSSVLSFLNPQEEESDYEIGLGEQAPAPSTKKGIPKEVYMVAGITVVIGGLWAYSHFKKSSVNSIQSAVGN